ncbi:hypothetical protein EGM88_00845 [Aureibaculum marinum]|uniref:Uncharacterized protein n=1 Tax=Aureibaculum marinum TaxID=2487930 RepID=A0A3N4P3E8_9FLAO|nr:DUF6095 family protein [Aureibaculum marinum]RPE00929.1 hypothetical protein EGM88_00845 [Aureibaculum marinum]
MKNKQPTLFNALKYLGIALPLLFIAPIVITIGFKAINRDNNYIFLILGIILALAAILTTAFGLVKISRYIFDGNKKNNKR